VEDRVNQLLELVDLLVEVAHGGYRVRVIRARAAA
jgi:hypothetical protein